MRVANCIVAAFIIASVASPGAVWAQELPTLPDASKPSAKDNKAAQRAYVRAQKFFQRNKLVRAQKEARKAYKLVPSWTTAMALSRILGELDLACASFRHALIAADLAKDAAQRAQANIELGKSGPGCKLGAIRVESKPAGARVEVGNVRFDAPRTVGLGPGDHAFTVTAPGMAVLKETVTVRLGLLTVKEFALSEEGEKPVDPPKVVCEPPLVLDGGTCKAPVVDDGGDKGGDRPVWEPSAGPWVLIGVGAALIVGGGVSLGLSQLELSKLNDIANPRPDMTDDERRAQYDDIIATAGPLHNVGLIVGGVGVAAVVGGIIWKVLDTAPEGQDAAGPLSPKLQLGPWNGPRRAGVMLQGVF